MNPVVNNVFYHRSLGRESVLSLLSLHSIVEFRLILRMKCSVAKVGLLAHNQLYEVS